MKGEKGRDRGKGERGREEGKVRMEGGEEVRGKGEVR